MAQTQKTGLGRGFESLLPADFDKSLLLSAGERIEKIPPNQLQASPHQPRKHFDKLALSELAISIKRYGIIQPLVVTPLKDGKYNLIAGERRWRAAVLAGLESVPAIIRSSQKLEQLEIALIENVQRVDLSPLEQAVSIERLHQQFNFSYDNIAKRLSKAPSTIINTVRLLNLPEAARAALATGKISQGHARAILALKSAPTRQAYLLKTILDQEWSVRQAERFVTSVKAGTRGVKKTHEHVATENLVTKQLSKKLGTPVTIRRTAHGGKFEISFKNDAELQKIISLFD